MKVRRVVSDLSELLHQYWSREGFRFRFSRAGRRVVSDCSGVEIAYWSREGSSFLEPEQSVHQEMDERLCSFRAGCIRGQLDRYQGVFYTANEGTQFLGSRALQNT